ncbi:cytochrome P450 [Streptomyces griseocarneus]|uniref:cytochrome P450 n=1 Tax=Streptomyces griseocarneus TaxID=51201 RepID=UPI00167EB32E|nr:cytochrome P450 [Streptomyces griseocarneus]MBZ6477917.1 cytochrome P450 [Streptomyces griseocarneus]GHG54263.1 cytochrome P450 [Streptomyces griseocarneus]
MSTETLFRRIADYASRADPYPLYAELREHGAVRQDDGSYLVGTYDEIAALLHDPRISSDRRRRTVPDALGPGQDDVPPAFIGLDDPEHDRLRRLAMRPFGPPHSPGRVDALRGEITRIAGELADGFADGKRIDVVDDFAYPLPVTVICRLLGVPSEDEPRFRTWSDSIVAGFDATPDEDPEQRLRSATEARRAMALYLGELAESRRGHPTGDMLSALVNDEGPEGSLNPIELMTTSVLLLIAGHETTVNLITNGVLTLLRHPDALARLRDDPALMPQAVEELLRYEPPVQMLPQRTPLADIEVSGVTIPQGAPLILVLASGNRDPLRFAEPDRFDITRPDNQHLGFGSGIHSCFGAPLARLETQIALTTLLPRLGDLRLVEDPPPYRTNQVLRGPRHLLVEAAG